MNLTTDDPIIVQNTLIESDKATEYAHRLWF